ncbi:MAG TPA: hypothetical protein VGH91_07370 [Gammaproteobacteria bacterium]
MAPHRRFDKRSVDCRETDPVIEEERAMSNQDESFGLGARNTRGWMLRVSHVTSSGITEARQPGKRRFGLQDRRLATRPEPSDRRCIERRDA